MRARREVFLSALCVLLAACAAAVSAPLDSEDATVEGVGILPGAGAAEPDPRADDGLSTTIVAPAGDASTTTAVPLPPIGSLVAGNKFLMIGDSITASAAERYGNELCEALVPLGWKVEVDAEPSRFIDFGRAVLDQRLAAKWDAAYVFLGTNYGGKQDVYLDYLEKLVERLSPMPVILVTVTEFAENRREVNDAILLVAVKFPNVRVLDWGAIAAADAENLLRGDGHHLTNAGREKLAASVAEVMGTAPVQPGDCLPTAFTADRGLDVNGSDKPSEKKVGGGTTATTVQAVTATTKPTATSIAPPTTSPVTQGTFPATTQGPPTSAPPPTAPPPTRPPRGGGNTTVPTVPTPTTLLPDV